MQVQGTETINKRSVTLFAVAVLNHLLFIFISYYACIRLCMREIFYIILIALNYSVYACKCIVDRALQ